MTNAFTRGLKILFGIRPKRRLAPYGSIARPRIYPEDFKFNPPFEEVVLKKAEVKKIIKKKSVKKKEIKNKIVKKKIAKKKITKKKIVKRKK